MQLFTELSTYLGIFSLLAVVFALFIGNATVKTARYCRSAVDWVQNNNKNAVSLRQIAELSTQVTELKDAYDALLESHKKLRARIGMRATREKRRENGAADETDVDSDRKTALRIRARQSGLLR